MRSRSVRSRRIWVSPSRVHAAGWPRSIDEGKKEGLGSDERAELLQLRRDKRVLEMEIEILKRACACFAGRTSSQQYSRWSENWPRTGSRRGDLPGPGSVDLGL